MGGTARLCSLLLAGGERGRAVPLAEARVPHIDDFYRHRLSLERVPPEEMHRYRARVPDEVMKHWPQAVIAYAAAYDHPAPVAIGELTQPQLNRIRQSLRQLRRHPKVDEARRWIIEQIRPNGAPPLSLEALYNPELWSWTKDKATSFSECVPVHRVPPQDVASYLIFTALFDGWDGLEATPDADDEVLRASKWPVILRNSRPTVWANLSRDDVSYPMRPGQIIVDATHCTEESFGEAWDAIKATQDRLGSFRPAGGNLPADDELMEFVHEFKSARSGRGKPLKRTRLDQAVRARFGVDLSDSALNARYRRWKERNGLE